MKKTIINMVKYSIVTFSIVSITILSTIINSNNSDNVSALTYQDNVGLNFTFNPSITVSLSSSDIVINDLTPGTNSDSNTIIVNVLSNNQNGYTLEANVGNSTTYDTRNLIMSSGAANFASIHYGSTIATLEGLDDNTWGYSYLDETLVGSTWSNYSGLPLYSDTEHTTILKTTNGPSLSTGDNIDFKIAAKASTTQASGEYNNVINFIAVGNPNPMSLYDAYASAGKTMYNGYYAMQDMTPEICSNVAVEESQLQVIDVRDNNVYTIAKLKDNRCWMTTNLNLRGGTQLSYEDTDFDSTWTLPMANGFKEDNTLPESSTIFSSPDGAVIYNSNRDDSSYCSSNPGCYSYYSWTAATLGSGVGITVANVDADYSICPKGWKLPTSRYSDPFDYGLAAESDFYNLTTNYGMSIGVWRQGTTAFYNNAGPHTVPDFRLPGYFAGTELYNTGYDGFYWSSTSQQSASQSIGDRAQILFFRTNMVSAFAGDIFRSYGIPIRCIANNS